MKFVGGDSKRTNETEPSTLSLLPMPQLLAVTMCGMSHGALLRWVHTPDPGSPIKSWHGKKGSLSAFPAAKLWDSATPATILLSPLSVSYHCYQNQKGRDTSTERYFCPVLAHWMGPCLCPPVQHGQHGMCGTRTAAGRGIFKENPNQSFSHTWANSEHLVFLSHLLSVPALT